MVTNRIQHETPPITILVPMAGLGKSFVEAGFSFPKTLIDIAGKTMIELVVSNLRPKTPHKFVFVVLKDHYERYDLHNILKRATHDLFEVVLLANPTQGAALTALTAIRHINHEHELILANADQYLDYSIDTFIASARKKQVDGYIMTFPSSHPRWSYVRPVKNSTKVAEVAEKKVISGHATVGIYYYRQGRLLVEAIQQMVKKNVRHNNEFYVCPAFNELILSGYEIHIHPIPVVRMHGLGTPEELSMFQKRSISN